MNTLLFYLRLGTDLLWPNGEFMQKADPPTPLQREQMRVRAERLLTVVIPRKYLISFLLFGLTLSLVRVSSILFETNDLNQLQSHIHDTLEPLQNKEINKHLMYLLVDLVLSKVFPELLISEPKNKMT